MKRVILLDADVPAYRFASRGQKEIAWDEGEEVVKVAPPEDWAIDNMLQYINDLKEELDAQRLVMCFSDAVRSNNWRLDVLSTYKFNRDPGSRPVLHDAMEAALSEHFEFFRKDTLEGDDVLGILATNNKIIKGHKIIVSIDKDLKTIPSRPQQGSDNTLVHVPKVGAGIEVVVTESDADWYWMYQTIIGDSTDGYKGCKGAGPVKAYQVLGEKGDGRTIEHYWPLVVELYESKDQTEADALKQAQVARIARAEDFNYKTKRVIPWLPKF